MNSPQITNLNTNAQIKGMGLASEKGTALFMTLIVLTSALTVALGVASLITPGILMGRTQTNSTKAFFAAESGAERALWAIRRGGFDASACGAGDCMDLNSLNCAPCAGLTYSLSNNAFYQVEYDASAGVVLNSDGDYVDTKRRIEISY